MSTRIFVVINPTESSINNSVHGSNAPYRSPRYVSYDLDSPYDFDTSSKEYLLVYKGDNITAPVGEYVRELDADKYSFYAAYTKSPASAMLFNPWNRAEVKSYCKNLIDVVFFNPGYTHKERHDCESVAGHIIQALRDGDIASAWWGAYKLVYDKDKNPGKKYFRQDQYQLIDTEGKRISDIFPDLNAAG